MEIHEGGASQNGNEPDMKSSVRELAKHLFDVEGPVDIYDLHERYLIGAAELLAAIKTLKDLGIVAHEREGFVSLSAEGRNRIWEMRRVLLVSDARPWADPQLDRRDPSSPYLPDLSKVDRAFFYRKVADSRA